MKFKNASVIITGGSSGIGLKTAELFLREGANIVINGRRESALKEAVTYLSHFGDLSKIKTVMGDISNPKTSKILVDEAINSFGTVDILINNTGKFVPTEITDYSTEDIDSYLDVIVKGTIYPSQAVIPEMRKNKKGVILNTGSIWALNPIEATPSAVYSAAMAGRHALTKNMAVELAKDQIRVNAVAPAVVDTPIYNNFLSAEEVPEVLNQFNEFHPLGRNGKPEDIAKAMLFLASDDASWITGTVLPVDGGATSRLR